MVFKQVLIKHAVFAIAFLGVFASTSHTVLAQSSYCAGYARDFAERNTRGQMKSVGQNINIMTVSAAHAEVFAGLHTACFPKAWSSEAFAKLLNMPGAMGFITTQNDNKEAAIGFALISNAGAEAEIVTLGVLPDTQRQGIGSYLINAIHKTCLECNTACVFLEVNAQDAGTISFYRNAGYECVGTRERYYKHGDAPADDALIMRKSLVILES